MQHISIYTIYRIKFSSFTISFSLRISQFTSGKLRRFLRTGRRYRHFHFMHILLLAGHLNLLLLLVLEDVWGLYWILRIWRVDTDPLVDHFPVTVTPLDHLFSCLGVLCLQLLLSLLKFLWLGLLNCWQCCWNYWVLQF